MSVCPNCGSALSRIDFPDFATVVCHIGVDLLFWAAVALLLGYLATPRGQGEWYAGLAALFIVAWLLLRPRQLAARRAFLDRARYHCETCKMTWPSG